MQTRARAFFKKEKCCVEQLDSPPPRSYAMITDRSTMTSRFGQFMIIRFLLLSLLLSGQSSLFADTPLRIAVASNYANALNKSVARYQAKTGDTRTISVSIGSTGKLFAQIQSGAPFDLFLAADVERPQKLAATSITLGPSQTYTIGRLVLWHPKHRTHRELGQQLGQIDRLAMANPQLAPYGLAAKQTLAYLNWRPPTKQTVVTAENVGQVFAMVKTGNADAGFVALSQVREQQVPSSQYRIIDEHMHQPIAQGVVLLKSGAQSKRALAFLNFLLDERATGIAMNKTPRKLGPAQTAGPKRSSVIDQ